ncbi:MAG TPA: glycosyltransferase family 2 protein [Nitrospirae bacterium]|nr:glycosyltransferase family 2 protein [Nitrospirota bacterium]HDN95252.1 glycosyltransferase family 2 protein [Nitrospirota bacterium]HDO66961.1 glycosyltransferase family 2 protein [Nitrospirota bacterium]HDZ84515.1 glycosyltransferase family 2 protein [Nitrospirota bacterium]HEW81135.1 glycosyltransferase family 2 protein [Nitrospirota bacterium]
MSKIPVSVAIITKNEARNIKDALESVKEFDDIVVVDEFSSDNTTEICREYTERVYEHEWQGYAGQKQTAIDYAKNDWVLILDADERVTRELKQEIMGKVKENSLSGFYIPRKNFFLGKWIRHGGWWPDHTLRLFRKDASEMEPRAVHEKVNVNGPVGHISAAFEHYTYRTISDFIGKMDNYASLSAEELDNKGFISSFISMLFSPMVVFIKMYLVRQGFRDGIHGLVLAVLYSFYTFLKYAKVLERKGGF